MSGVRQEPLQWRWTGCCGKHLALVTPLFRTPVEQAPNGGASADNAGGPESLYDAPERSVSGRWPQYHAGTVSP